MFNIFSLASLPIKHKRVNFVSRIFSKKSTNLADIKIAAVFRSREYSPNHIGTDAAILNEVCDQLRKRGCNVTTFSEEQLGAVSVDEAGNYNCWLTMARSPRSIERLQSFENVGIKVINSAYGIANCRRGKMSIIISGHNLPFPDFYIVKTDELVLDRLKKGHYTKCWIKQADQHSMHKEDVTFVRHPEEAQEVLQEYFMRGIREAIVCRHQSGDLIRFYGVQGTNFFEWFFPMDERHFAPDSNDTDPHRGVDRQKLQTLCDKAAEALDLTIYGGDCIVLPDGELKIIDVNDWPSFAPCRKAAASFIARHVLKLLK